MGLSSWWSRPAWQTRSDKAQPIGAETFDSPDSASGIASSHRTSANASSCSPCYWIDIYSFSGTIPHWSQLSFLGSNCLCSSPCWVLETYRIDCAYSATDHRLPWKTSCPLECSCDPCCRSPPLCPSFPDLSPRASYCIRFYNLPRPLLWHPLRFGIARQCLPACLISS